MLTALRLRDNVKVIGNFIEKSKDEIYLCEGCGGEVIHHKSSSKAKVGHFKHRRGSSDCPSPKGESEYHFTTKLDIFSYIEDGWGNSLALLEVEKWICGNTIRPDIYIETFKGKRIAIELQATILTADEILERTKKYSKNGIYVLWVLPYEHSRFCEQDKSFDTTLKEYVYTEQWYYSRRVRLKEMEIFLYWAYGERLLFWDTTHEHSISFISIKFEDYFSDDSEYYTSDGTHNYFEGKKAKKTKQVDSISYDISYDELRTQHLPLTKPAATRYLIPERGILTYKES